MKFDVEDTKDITYPCLKIHAKNRTIIAIFTSENSGFIVKKGESLFNLGSPIAAADCWEVFNGKLVLSNI